MLMEHKNEGKESQKVWGYWSPRCSLETDFVLFQCQRSACWDACHLCPLQGYWGCLDLASTMSEWDLSPNPENRGLQSNKQKILPSIPVPPFSFQYGVSSSLLMTWRLCLHYFVCAYSCDTCAMHSSRTSLRSTKGQELKVHWRKKRHLDVMFL